MTDMSMPDRLPHELEPAGAVQTAQPFCDYKPVLKLSDSLRPQFTRFKFCPWCGKPLKNAEVQQ